MKLETNNFTVKLVLEDSGEIARVLVAFAAFNMARTGNGLKTIPISIMNQMEDCLGQ